MTNLSATTSTGPGSDPGKQRRAELGLPVVPSFDGFRAFAILGIVAFHLIVFTLDVTGDAARVAVFGIFPNLVETLFIVSGFVVFLPTVARNGDFGPVGSFAIRRAARLVPAYWVAILVVLLIIVAWPAAGLPHPSFGEVLAHIAMLHVPVSLFDTNFSLGMFIDGPLWTLSLEAIFYLLLPLIATAYYRRPFVGLALAAAIAIAWKEIVIHLDTVLSWLSISLDGRELELTRLAADNQFPGFAYSFALGMTAAWIYVWATRHPDRDRISRLASRGQLISLIALILSAYLFGRYAITTDSALPAHVARRSPIVSPMFTTSLAAAMLCTALAPTARQRLFAAPRVRALGDISYGIYLVHLPFILFSIALFARNSGDGGQFLTALAIGVPAAIAYGWVSARLLEQPIRRWAQRFGRRAKAEAAVGAEPGAGAEPGVANAAEAEAEAAAEPKAGAE